MNTAERGYQRGSGTITTTISKSQLQQLSRTFLLSAERCCIARASKRLAPVGRDLQDVRRGTTDVGQWAYASDRPVCESRSHQLRQTCDTTSHPALHLIMASTAQPQTALAATFAFFAGATYILWRRSRSMEVSDSWKQPRRSRAPHPLLSAHPQTTHQ